MKTTTTIMDIIQAGLINAGHNEFLNKINGVLQITNHSDEFTFILKIQHYDDDVRAVVDSDIFGGFKFSSSAADLFFKRMFISRFLDRQINTQTLDLFRHHLISYCLANDSYVTMLYDNIEDYYLGTHNSSSDNTSATSNNSTTTNEATGGNNSAERDLPQDNVNLDLHADTTDYANTNSIFRSFDNSNSINDSSGTANSHSDGTDYNFDVGTLNMLKYQWTSLLDDFDAKLFLQIW